MKELLGIERQEQFLIYYFYLAKLLFCKCKLGFGHLFLKKKHKDKLLMFQS